MKQIHFALIGAGKHGARWAGVLAKDKNVSLDIIYDNKIDNAIRLAKQVCGSKFVCIVAKDINKILENKEINAVLVVVPHKYLSPITELAFKAGKHVLCEKPGAITSRQIKKNADLAKKKGLVYKIGYNYRFHDAFKRARKLFDKGVIGKLVFIRAKHGFGGRTGYEKEWRINKDIGGGGHLHDQGVHMIDMAKSFMGEIKEVKGLMSSNYWKSGTEDNGFVLLKDKNNVIASIHSSLTQWKRTHAFEIYGTKGYLIIEGLGMRYGDGEKLIVGKCTKDPDKPREKVVVCNPVADNSLAFELEEFISAIRKGTPISPVPMEASETLKIIEEIYRTNKR